MHFSLASDLARDGYTEDGDENIVEVFYITAVDDAGNRRASPSIDSKWLNSFRHDKHATELMTDRIMFMASRWCPMMIYACAIIAQDHGLITEGNLMLNVSEPQLDYSQWPLIDPVYGSVAYQQQEVYIVQREREDDLMFNR